MEKNTPGIGADFKTLKFFPPVTFLFVYLFRKSLLPLFQFQISVLENLEIEPVSKSTFFLFY
jgi:hypothetical protein